MTTTAIDPTAAPLRLTTWERPRRGGGEEPGLRPGPSPSSQLPRRTAAARLRRFLTEPRQGDGVRHADFFVPYGRPRVDRPRPFC